jgi:DNA-binding PadR family transcriptional regulator
MEKLHPAGKQTIATMLAKGWIERRSTDHGRAAYFITAAGQAALKAPIPGKS